MSYTLFLIIFVCVPLAAFGFVMRKYLRPIHLLGIAGLAVIAIVYTTPWDNYLVASGVWYYDTKLVLGVLLGYVPLEEYAFYILQAALTGLFTFWLWQRFYPESFAEIGAKVTKRQARQPKK
jgi:lycopene beta-cyclase